MRVSGAFNSHSISVRVYKLICDIAFNQKSYIGFLAHHDYPLLEQMLTILQDSTDGELVMEVSNCVCLFLFNLPNLPADLKIRAQTVLKGVMDKNLLTEGGLEFIQQMF